MNIRILEEKKNKLVFAVEGDSHTLTSALRAELASTEHVKAAGYSIDHPLVGHPRFVVETDGADPRKLVRSVLGRLSKQASKLATEAAKEL